MDFKKGNHKTIPTKATDRQRITKQKDILDQLHELFETEELTPDYSQVHFIEKIAKEVRKEFEF